MLFKWSITGRFYLASAMFVSVLTMHSSALAATINVPADQPTIQAGINAAVNGDEVVIAPGTYFEVINFNGKNITVRSSDGPDVTTIDGTGFGTSVVKCISGELPTAVLKGLTITGGNSFAGGGMDLWDSWPTIINCTFLNNVASSAGGAVVVDSYTLHDVEFYDCRFYGNFATNYGGALVANYTSLALWNCTFAGNSANRGGAISGVATFYNNIFYDNTKTGTDYGGNVVWGPGSIFYNCIVWGNGSYGYWWSHSVTTINCDLQLNNYGGDGTNDFFTDPLWVDPVAYDFHLQPSSPCINRGYANTTILTDFDIDGEPRVQDCIVDVGIDESSYFPDCNANGLSDGCELNSDPSIDCDGNGVIDACEIAVDPSLDCNTNGFIDSCDLNAGTSLDINFTGTPDECEGFYAYNVTQGSNHSTIADAIGVANAGDQLLAPAVAFGLEANIDFLGKAITLDSLEAIDQPVGGVLILAHNATVRTSGTQAMTLGGELRITVGAADVIVDRVDVTLTGALNVQSGAFIDIESTSGIVNDGVVSIFGTLSSNAGIINQNSGVLTASGFIVGNMVNDGQATFNGDSYIVGDYANNGVTDIVNGALDISGSLTNTGTINGNVTGGLPLPPRGVVDLGLRINGDMSIGSSASLVMASGQLSVVVAGAYDVAINDNTKYDMVLAELRTNGTSGTQQTLEIMSVDIGADVLGLDHTLPGHYPIGTLRIGPNATTVNMVDNHDNDNLGQQTCEAIYVQNLIIESGATLNTNGCFVYYQTLVLQGIVDLPSNLVEIVIAPACPADITGDGTVDIVDLLQVIGAWGPCMGCLADINGDSVVDVLDLLEVIGAWGVCP